MNALDLIAAERARQISQEGWTPEHDDKYVTGQLASAAESYVGYVAMVQMGQDDGEEGPPFTWPWDDEWWKPTTPLRNLVKAGALIVAEIERLQRKDPNP